MTTISTVSVTPTAITISWPDLTDITLNGRDVPYYYQVEWYNGASWEIKTSEASGKFLQWTHNISPSIFPSNSNQQYRVTPKNQVGWGTTSSTITVQADTEPQSVTSLSATQVDPYLITITWTNLTTNTETGRDPITFYSVEWDQGLGTANAANWVAVNAESAGIQNPFPHPRATLFPPGQNVNYRVRAKNGVGFGPYSAVLPVLTDTIPVAMTPPSALAADINPYWIKLSWSPLAFGTDTGRDTIIFYDLQWD